MDAAGSIVDASKAAWAALAAAFAAMEFAIPAFELCCSEAMAVTSSDLGSASPPPPPPSPPDTASETTPSGCEVTMATCLKVTSGVVRMTLLPPGIQIKLKTAVGAEAAVTCAGRSASWEKVKEVNLFNVYGVEGKATAGLSMSASSSGTGSVSFMSPLIVSLRSVFVGSGFLFLPPMVSLGKPTLNTLFSADASVTASLQLGTEISALAVASAGVAGELSGAVTVAASSTGAGAGLTLSAKMSGAAGLGFELPTLVAFCGGDDAPLPSISGIGISHVIFEKSIGVSVSTMAAERHVRIMTMHRAMMSKAVVTMDVPVPALTHPPTETLPPSSLRNASLVKALTTTAFVWVTSGTCPNGPVSEEECFALKQDGQACGNEGTNCKNGYEAHTNEDRPLGCRVKWTSNWEGRTIKYNLATSGSTDCSDTYRCLCKSAATDYPARQSEAVQTSTMPTVPATSRTSGYCTVPVSQSECAYFKNFRDIGGDYELTGSEDYPHGCFLEPKDGDWEKPRLRYNLYQSSTECSSDYKCLCSEPPLQVAEVTTGAVCSGTNGLDAYDCERHAMQDDEFLFETGSKANYAGPGCAFNGGNGDAGFVYNTKTTTNECTENRPCICRSAPDATQDASGATDTAPDGLFTDQDTAIQDTLVEISTGVCETAQQMTATTCEALAAEVGGSYGGTVSLSAKPPGCYQKTPYATNNPGLYYFNDKSDSTAQCELYSQITSGTVDAERMLSAVECEAAATELGLTYTSVSRTDKPAGCFYGASLTNLKYNTVSSSTVDCDSTNPCVEHGVSSPCFCLDAPPSTCYLVPGLPSNYEAVQRISNMDSPSECADAVIAMGTFGEWIANGETLKYSVDGAGFLPDSSSKPTGSGECFAFAGLSSDVAEGGASIFACRIGDCTFEKGEALAYTTVNKLSNTKDSRGECYSRCRSKYDDCNGVVYVHSGSDMGACYCYEGLTATDPTSTESENAEVCTFS